MWKSSPYLLSVVDLPDEGLPTRPISGSRGIVAFQSPMMKPVCEMVKKIVEFRDGKCEAGCEVVLSTSSGVILGLF